MSRSFGRFLGAAAGAVVTALLLVAPAVAAAPANDTFAGAVTISALPFGATLDTTQATTDADDVAAGADCGEPATEASVWYALTPAGATHVNVDVSASNYSASVIVVRGTPGNFEAVTCGPDSVNFSSDPAGGVTYYVLAFDDTPGPPNGGTLQINVREVPSPTGTVTVNPTGAVKPKTGVITVSGTFTCANSDFAFIDLLVQQNVGRFTISGFAEPDLAPCDGQPHSWSANVPGTDRRFVGVKATADAYLLACNAFTCASDEAIQTIRLRGRP